jgi:YHS domain-containing protein
MAAIDPVCGMTVEEDSAAATAEYKGTTYYFCSVGCKKDFEEDPKAYLVAS